MSFLCDTKPSHLFPETTPRLAEMGGAGDDERLNAVGDLLATYASRQEKEAAHARAVLQARSLFADAAARTFEQVVKPTFLEIAEQLNEHGGGGLVEERPVVANHGKRLILWMSLEGPVVAPPRADRNPYIQLDVDVLWRRITVWEGDMWHKLGASRRTEAFALEELTTESVNQRAIGVLRRSINHDSRSDEEPP